jgi:hypothetical protein
VVRKMINQYPEYLIVNLEKWLINTLNTW